jgi:hypothetical protein
MKGDEYGFALVNFIQMLPFSKGPFAFPIHKKKKSSNDPCEIG